MLHKLCHFAQNFDNPDYAVGFFLYSVWASCCGGRQPVILVPSRNILDMHPKPELQPAFAAGRLLILPPFEPKHK